ncbi:hypothetical protein K1X84_01820 [bacterium]|nr:hypothetical protein [bacterium]
MKVIIGLWLVVSTLYGQDEQFFNEMKTALTIHDTSSTLESEMMAINAFEKAAERYPLQWLSCFWASYVHSQIARLYIRDKKSDAAVQSFKQAQFYFDQIKVKAKSMTVREKSSTMALQSLIYLLQINYLPQKNLQKDAANELSTKASGELIKAIQTDPANPVVWVMIGVNLIRDGKQDKDIKKTVAGKVLLEAAEREFKSTAEHRSKTTNFNSEWLPFWIPEANRQLQ